LEIVQIAIQAAIKEGMMGKGDGDGKGRWGDEKKRKRWKKKREKGRGRRKGRGGGGVIHLLPDGVDISEGVKGFTRLCQATNALHVQEPPYKLISISCDSHYKYRLL